MGKGRWSCKFLGSLTNRSVAWESTPLFVAIAHITELCRSVATDVSCGLDPGPTTPL